MPEFDVARLGQVFTPDIVADFMCRLVRNNGRVLEPSCGDGVFARRFVQHPQGCVALEIDPRHAPEYAQTTDFFAYPLTERFATIIGNPPYVRHQDIDEPTRQLFCSQLFDSRANLYLFFIEKCVQHLLPGGELIFITPRDFLKSTSSVRLNQWLLTQGSFTDVLELGDARIFSDVEPNCLIWRFEKDRRRRDMRFAALPAGKSVADGLAQLTWQTRLCLEVDGHLIFAARHYPLRLRDLASVKVGAVSGCDEIYASDEAGTRDFVCSATAKTGQTRRMIWPEGPTPPEALLPHKDRLINRRIKPFNESNWWQWGRGYPDTPAPRVYVNGKTRQKKPFYVHECTAFDGAVLAIFPLRPDIEVQALADALNTVDWDELGFYCDGRFLFTQRSLENAPLPASFAPFAPEAVQATLEDGAE